MFRLEVDKETNLVFMQPSMAGSLFELVDKNREYLTQWMPWVTGTKSSNETRYFIERSVIRFAKGETLVCGIEYKTCLAGVVGFNKISEELKKVEIGYWLSAHLQGNGIMTRCCQKLIEYAFEEMGMQKVEICAATENSSSRNVCQRLGCSLEGVITNAENIDGRIVDHAVYGIHKTAS